ncbi:MAG: ABC transporter permease subunit, partial [Deltaproteobacteria bacterium]
ITILIAAQSVLGYFLPPGTNFDIVLRVVILVTLFSAAYNAETIRGALAALPRGQYEAANAMGMDYWTSQRLIILPQAMKISIPGIVGNFIGLFKDTTLVSIIGIYDLVGLFGPLDASTDWKGIYWEFYFIIAVIFFIFCFSMSRYSIWLERRLRTDIR